MTGLAVLLGGGIGLVLGLTGAGGSILAVPILMIALNWSLPQAAPVALLAVCAAATLGTVAAWDATRVRYRAAALMAGLAMLSAPLGLALADRLDASVLSAVFATVLAVVGLRMVLQARRAPQDTLILRAHLQDAGAHTQEPLCRLDPDTGRFQWTRRCTATISAIGAATGFLAGLLGVGGGFVIVPALRAATELSVHSAIATSLMAIALISGITVIAALMQGRALPLVVAAPFVAGAVGGMLAGRSIAPRIAGPKLQRGFAAVMGLVALAMAAQALNLF